MNINSLIYSVPAVLIAISMHEFSHGYASYRMGDPTPKMKGRLSINPLAHLDLIGTLALLFFHFGWAKPVEVNPNYYRDPRKGMMVVALAGPFMNFTIALLSIFSMGLLERFVKYPVGIYMEYFYNLLYYMSVINIGLGVFNLIPVPPLDGSKVLGAVLPPDQYFRYMQYERYGMVILIALLYTGVINTPLNYARTMVTASMETIVRVILGL